MVVLMAESGNGQHVIWYSTPTVYCPPITPAVLGFCHMQQPEDYKFREDHPGAGKYTAFPETMGSSLSN